MNEAKLLELITKIDKLFALGQAKILEDDEDLKI